MELRLAGPADGEGLAAVYAPIVASTAHSFEYVPPSPEEMAARVATTGPDHPWVVAEDDGLAGYAYAGPHAARPAYAWSADVSVYLRPAARRRGLGTALYTALLALLRCQGFHQVYAGIALPNPASVALHEAVGFACLGVYRHVGWKHGAWHDVGWWQRPLAPPDTPPAPRRPLDRLTDDEIGAALDQGRARLAGGADPGARAPG